MNSLLNGQEVPVKILKTVLNSGRIAHAYLFKGPEGSGKAVLAKEFAKGLLCLGQHVAGEIITNGVEVFSCGVCVSCTEVSKATHPDLFMIEKNGASIKIKASHAVLKEVLTRPFVSKRKVFVIDEAETLTPQAANALLKLLEEPPAYVTFILTTSNESSIPDTVVSRCQVIPLRALPSGVIADYLKDKHGVLEEESWEIANLSGGNIHKAVQLLSQIKGQSITGKELVGRITANSPINLALEYSKACIRERREVLATLELELARKLDEVVEKGKYRKHEANVADDLKQNYRLVKSVVRAKERLNANTNSFLVFSTLFLDIRRCLLGQYEAV